MPRALINPRETEQPFSEAKTGWILSQYKSPLRAAGQEGEPSERVADQGGLEPAHARIESLERLLLSFGPDHASADLTRRASTFRAVGQEGSLERLLAS